MSSKIVTRIQAVSQQTYTRKILPLGFCSAATLALGNMAYLYLEVGFVQMLKSCCPVFVLFVALLLQLETFSISLIASVALIAGGTATTAATGTVAPTLTASFGDFNVLLMALKAFRSLTNKSS